MTLPEARVECWQGFVFINRDADALPLQDDLGHWPKHFAEWSYKDHFLPVLGDPNRANYEFMIFKPKDGDVPEVHRVEFGENDTFAGAGISPPWHGEIYDQDIVGLRMCQQGMRDSGNADIFYSAYQEVRIWRLHQTLDRYLSDDPANTPSRR